MSTVVGVVILFLLFSVFFIVILYVLISGETTSTAVADRGDATNRAKEFGGIDSRNHRSRRRASETDGRTRQDETIDGRNEDADGRDGHVDEERWR